MLQRPDYSAGFAVYIALVFKSKVPTIMEILSNAFDALKSSGLLKEIYTDLAKPGVSQVGEAIGAIVGLGNTALWPVHMLNERAKLLLEANLDRYREKLKAVAQEDVVAVPPEVGIPILERFSYVAAPSLREMYCNLLAMASAKDTERLAHPSFVTILNSITPDEALLLGYLKKNHQIEFHLINEHGIQSVSFGLQVTRGFAFPTNVAAYVSNLEGLGVLKVSDDAVVTPPLGLSENYNAVGYARVTEFGQMFLKTCV